MPHVCAAANEPLNECALRPRRTVAAHDVLRQLQRIFLQRRTRGPSRGGDPGPPALQKRKGPQALALVLALWLLRGRSAAGTPPCASD
jgi:hypothetical protein